MISRTNKNAFMQQEIPLNKQNQSTNVASAPIMPPMNMHSQSFKDESTITQERPS